VNVPHVDVESVGLAQLKATRPSAIIDILYTIMNVYDNTYTSKQNSMTTENRIKQEVFQQQFNRA